MEVFFQTLGHYLKLEAYKPCPFVVKKMIDYWFLARLGPGPFGCSNPCSLLLCLLRAIFYWRTVDRQKFKPLLPTCCLTAILLSHKWKMSALSLPKMACVCVGADCSHQCLERLGEELELLHLCLSLYRLSSS